MHQAFSMWLDPGILKFVPKLFTAPAMYNSEPLLPKKVNQETQVERLKKKKKNWKRWKVNYRGI